MGRGSPAGDIERGRYTPRLAAHSDPADIVIELDRRGTRFHTPCGDGALVWRTWGTGDPLLLLHGAHGSWMHWIRNIDALSQSHLVIVPDLPGYGESAVPVSPADGPSFAKALAAGLRQIGTNSPINVIGFSLGGVISANLAAMSRDLVRRLILVDSGGLGTPVGDASTRSIRELTGDALREAHRHNLLRLMLHNPDSLDDLALYIQTLNVPQGRINPIPLVIPDKLRAVLPYIEAPIDAIWGEFDAPHPDPEVQLKIIHMFQPNAQMQVIAGAGHWSIYERADAFNAAALELLASPLHKRCAQHPKRAVR